MLCARCEQPKATPAPLCFRCAHLKLSRYGKRQMPRIWRENKRTAWKVAQQGMERLLKKWFGS